MDNAEAGAALFGADELPCRAELADETLAEARYVADHAGGQERWRRFEGAIDGGQRGRLLDRIVRACRAREMLESDQQVSSFFAQRR